MTTTSRGLGGAWQKLCVEARRVYEPVCWLCSQPIDTDLPATHPMSWTLDHRDPRAMYGTDVPTLDRTAPAHRRCNSRRNSRPTPVPSRWVM